MKTDFTDSADFPELTPTAPIDQRLSCLCSVCSTELPAESSTPLCPVCLLRSGSGPERLAGAPIGDQKHGGSAGGVKTFNPRRFGHYEILTGRDGTLVELGRGAMGITFKAVDLNLQIPVTLKLLNLRVFAEEKARRRFLREARATASVRHPNVASVYHLGARGREMFYAMEFVEGETLQSLIQRAGPLEIMPALDIAAQVASGLGAVHKQDLVHRDIKPSNIMVSGAEESCFTAKIIDLGLAKFVNEPPSETVISVLGTFAGTPEYASPEQFVGIGVDIRSDLYSLGVTLWSMLTGQVPYRGNALAVMHQHQYAPLPLQQLMRMPQPVVGLLQTLLEKDPARRFQNPAELSKAIATVSGAIKRGCTADDGRLRNAPSGRSRQSQKGAVKSGSYDLCLRGMALVELQDRDANQKAIRLFKKALKQDSTCALAYVGLARAYLEEEGFGGEKSLLDSAVEAARLATALDPAEVRAYYSLARAYFLKGWDPQCDEAVQMALAAGPDDDRVNAIAAVRAVARHQFAEAYKFFWKAFSLNPSVTWRIYAAVEILFRAGLTTVAEKWMQQALDRETNPQSHRMMQCYRMMWRGKFATARVGFTQLSAKLQNNNYSVFDGLLQCTIGMGDWPTVIESRDAYLENNPDDLWLKTYLAIALQKSGREAEARKMVGEVLECGLERLERPGQPDIPWDTPMHVAWAYRVVDRKNEAFRYLDTYLAHRTLIQISLGFDNPILDAFRGDPEFGTVVAGLNQKFEVASRLIQEQENSLSSD